MLYMLDTNIVSDVTRNPGGSAARRARIEANAVCVSIIVAAELRYGCTKKGSAQLSRKVDDFLSAIPVLPFEICADHTCGHLQTELEVIGRPIGSNDLLIAAHAYALGATIVTGNIGGFQRIDGLKVENWLA